MVDYVSGRDFRLPQMVAMLRSGHVTADSLDDMLVHIQRSSHELNKVRLGQREFCFGPQDQRACALSGSGHFNCSSSLIWTLVVAAFSSHGLAYPLDGDFSQLAGLHVSHARGDEHDTYVALPLSLDALKQKYP